MGLRALRDTYAYEQTGPDTKVRRKVVAGSEVPSHYSEFEDEGAVEEFDSGEPVPGIVDYRRPPGVGDAKPGSPYDEDEVRAPETAGEPEGRTRESSHRAGVGRSRK